MTELRLANVSLSYERQSGFGRVQKSLVLDRLSLTIGRGEFVAVIGRSGSGKTSLLNLAAGFVAPTEGRITVGATPVTGPGADRAVVFQDDALFAWLSARDNVALPLRLRGLSAPERKARADQLLALVGLAEHGDRSTWQLSGGQRQRVGIARALAAEPQFLLLDEPLGALDAMTREKMQELLLKVWAETGTGVLLITHSVEEALFLGTRVVVLAPGPGRIVEDRKAAFSQRFLAGEKARNLKADPAFIAQREDLLAAIDEDEERQVA
ncbi:MAG: ATP-binding cassette domain-containing protein [Devosia sp.]